MPMPPLSRQRSIASTSTTTPSTDQTRGSYYALRRSCGEGDGDAPAWATPILERLAPRESKPTVALNTERTEFEPVCERRAFSASGADVAVNVDGLRPGS